MNHCVYFYKNKLIGSIIDLDTFLLERKQYETKLGDIVFDKNENSRVLHTLSLLKDAEKHSEYLQTVYNKARKNYLDGELSIRPSAPYVGVSGFLSGQKNSNGELYFPEFIEKNYWKERYLAWSEGKFTPEESDLLFNGKKEIPIPLGNPNDWLGKNGELLPEFGTKEQCRVRDLIKDRWKHQSEYGTEIHNVLQQFFSSDSKGNLRGELWNQDPKQLEKSVKYLRSKNLISDIIDDSKLQQIIEYANNLKNKLESTYGRKGGNLHYFPEFTISTHLNKEYHNDSGELVTEILGRLDLLVIDEDGNPHIIDYKTSPKTYDDYSSSKKLGFTYQLGTYQRMLRRWGLNTLKTDVMVAPIALENFHLENDKWVYDNIKAGVATIDPLINLNNQLTKEYLNNNLDEFIEAPLIIDGDSEDIINKVSNIFDQWFPKFGDNRKKTDEQIRSLISEQNGFTVNPQSGLYEYLPKGSHKPITVKASEGEEGIFNAVKKVFNNKKERSVENASNIIKALEDAQINNTNELIMPDYVDNWVNLTLSKYCNRNWEVLTNNPAADAALQYGIILLHNKNLDTIDVVKISGNHLKYQNSWGENRNNITGGIEIDGKGIADSDENSKSDSLILKAVDGNIELMETLLVLNNLKFNKDISIGKIQVISNIQDAEGLTASNKELLYNWEKLNSLIPVEEDKIKNKQIKFLTKAESCYMEFQEVFNRASESKTASRLVKYKPAINDFYSAVKYNDVETAILKLNKIRKDLEDSFGMYKDIDQEKRSIHSKLENYNQQLERTLYQQISAAILELNNFDVRQAIKDHNSYVQSLKIHKNGLSGNYLDNAGNFGNAMLNQVTALALEGYQNGRDLAQPRLASLRKKVEELKKISGYNILLEHTIGNQADLYKDMTYYSKNGDLLFVNPWDNKCTLSPNQIEFLKMIIIEINKDRFPNYSETQLENLIKINSQELFQVPLTKSSFASQISTEGWNQWFKNKCKMFSSKDNIKDFLERQATEFFSSEEESKSSRDYEIFKAINLMDQGNSSNRLEIINKCRSKYGDGYFERDLESILSNHIWAYSVQKSMENRLPLIKAAYISLAVMGNEQNYSFTNDEKFLREFVDNKINHKTITEYRKLKGTLGIIQQAASWMALAFSPVQFSYQSLEGIWKASKLIITKPDGTETFSCENFKKSAKIVYSELFNYSDVPSKTSSINAFYGINDMDNASFAENNTSNRHGIFNFFGKFAYKFSSRPDFYNRMTIFVAQMIQDGSWNAHSVDPKTQKLVYDWKKDERFKAYANDDKSDLDKYNKSRALYYATAKQLIIEGARNEDGSLFILGEKVPLPKAYSNKESEAKKAIGDSMYGYYDSTKKSLMQSTLLGGLLMQMRTYWSAKKNQYLAPGGIKAQGKWEQAKNPSGELLFYSKNKNGNIDVNSTMVTKDDPNCSDIPFMQWKGKFEEGILLTVFDLAKKMCEYRSISEGWNAKLNDPNIDPDVLATYRSNLKLLVTDFAMWILIGSAALALGNWADDLDKDSKKSNDLNDSLNATFANIAYRTVKNSSLDFAWWNAIFDISMDWNPFAISYIGNEITALCDLAIGDENFTSVLTQSFSAARQVRPILRYVLND